MTEMPEKEMEEIAVWLSKSDGVDYYFRREEMAKKLEISVASLDKCRKEAVAQNEQNKQEDLFPKIEPWNKPVAVNDLLNEIFSIIKKYIVCREEDARAVALWACSTWLIEYVEFCPILLITAPEKRCGKSQLLDLLSNLVRKPYITSDTSSAAIFRLCDKHQPTLLIDEVDRFLHLNEQMQGIINAGHRKHTALVLRTVGDNHEVKKFNCFCFKALSGISASSISSTITDRSIVIHLRRRLKNEKIERLRHLDKKAINDLQSKLVRFALDYGKSIVDFEVEEKGLEKLSDRSLDNWETLLYIAKLAGSDWEKEARSIAVLFSQREAIDENANELLKDCFDALLGEIEKFITATDLLFKLRCLPLEDNPYNNMSKQQLASRLRKYELKSEQKKLDGKNLRRYDVESIREMAKSLCAVLENDATSLPSIEKSEQ